MCFVALSTLLQQATSQAIEGAGSVSKKVRSLFALAHTVDRSTAHRAYGIALQCSDEETAFAAHWNSSWPLACTLVTYLELKGE